MKFSQLFSTHKATIITLCLMVVGGLVASSPALAQLKPVVGVGSGRNIDLVETVLRIINMVLMLVSLLAAVFIIIAGIRYIVSQGGDEAETAKKSILYAVIGLVVIGLAAAIVNFTVGIFL